MILKFTKMQGAGNDYIFFNCLEKELDDPSGVARAMSPRHYSVGADGIVMICRSDVADAKMRMFNADGSEGKMCGNAIRCVGKYLYDNGLTDRSELSIETAGGIRTLSLFTENGRVTAVRVGMGRAELRCGAVPVIYDGDSVVNAPIAVAGETYRFTAVSMGNPHAVVFTDDVSSAPLEKIGPLFENHDMFPESVNTEFVRVASENTLEMRVWERGSGETYACGTGACAAAVAAVVNGFCRSDSDIRVRLRGGALTVRVGHELDVTLTGDCEHVFDGEYGYTPAAVPDSGIKSIDITDKTET